MRQQPSAVLCQGVPPLKEHPVIDQGTLIHGIKIQQFLGRAGVFKFAAVKPLYYNLLDPLKIKAVLVTSCEE